MNSSFVFMILKIIEIASPFYILLLKAKIDLFIIFIKIPLQNSVVELVFLHFYSRKGNLSNISLDFSSLSQPPKI